MKYIFGILLLLPILSGCNETATASSDRDNSLIFECDGFMPAEINVFVRNSLTEEIIDSALVQIFVEDEANTVIEAEYISEDDQISNTETFAYYAPLDVNLNEFEYGIVVSDTNHHTHVVKNKLFTLNTSCMADNSVTTDIYLCTLGTACL